MSSTKKINEIKDEMLIIIHNIQEKNKWKTNRDINDIKIEIGNAPEYSENFGVVRKKNKIIFGKWINEVEPITIQNNFWEFLIIRESFAFFFNEKLLFGEVKFLTNIFINILALSFLQESDPEISRDSKFFPIRGRFLMQSKDDNRKELYAKIQSLIVIVNQGLTYNLLYNTFTNFIEDLSIEDIDIEEILDDLYRYLSNDSEEIAAPIKLKENTTNFLLEFIDFGADKSITELAKSIGVNQSTIARQMAKVSSKFYARWRLEKNYKKLGLHSYLLLIRIPKHNENLLNTLSEEILEINYIQQFYEGSNEDFYYQYSVFHCPHIVSIRLVNKLEVLLKKGIIHSFEIMQIKDRIFKTSIISEKFLPTIDNFKKLILGEIPVKKVILYNNDKQKNQYKENFDEKDINLLKFISIIISKTTSKFGLFGSHLEPLIEFFHENNYDPNNQPECLSFLNRLQNYAFERELFEYRFNISLTGTASSNLFIIKIKSSPDLSETNELIEKLSCFGWTLTNITINEVFITILGPYYNHPLAKLIEAILSESKIEFETFSVKTKVFRYVDYSQLYDFKSQKFIPK